MTDLDRRQFEPTCSDHTDPIDSFSWGALLVGLAFSGAGCVGMAYSVYLLLTR